MTDSADIHHYRERLENALKNFEKDKSIRDDNKKIILTYVRFSRACGLSIPRQVRYLTVLKKLCHIIEGPLNSITKTDVIEFIERTNEERTAAETKRTERECLKHFVRWLKCCENAEEYPPEVKWVKVGTKLNERKLPESILTEDEILRMVESSPNARDKAFIVSLYESGSRIGEWLSLSVGSLSPSEYGTVAMIPRGKTGARRVPHASAFPPYFSPFHFMSCPPIVR